MQNNKNIIYQIASLLIPIIVVGLFCLNIGLGCSNGDTYQCFNDNYSPLITEFIKVLFFIILISNFVLFFNYAKKKNFENITLLILNSILTFVMFLAVMQIWALIFFCCFLIITVLIPVILFFVAYIRQIISVYKNLKDENTLKEYLEK